MFSAIPKILVSKPGDVLPVLGIPLEEDADSKKKRSKFRGLADCNIDINNTYTFSVYCPTIDFPNWNMVSYLFVIYASYIC